MSTSATKERVRELARESHYAFWSEGNDVSEQTKKSQKVCKDWQEAVVRKFGERFTCEHKIADERHAHKIDIVDQVDRVAYELKASKNNLHMELYRDVFKTLVHNRMYPLKQIRTLVFMAPGTKKLGCWFPESVKAIAEENGLCLLIEEIPRQE